MHSSIVVSDEATTSGDDMISRTGASLRSPLERHATKVVALGDDPGDLTFLGHEQ